MLNPNAAEWTPTAFSTATAVIGTSTSAFISSCAASKNAAGVGQLSVQASTHMQVDSDSGLATPNGLAELASVLSGATSADMTFEDLLFDNSSRRGSVSLHGAAYATHTLLQRVVVLAQLAMHCKMQPTVKPAQPTVVVKSNMPLLLGHHVGRVKGGFGLHAKAEVQQQRLGAVSCGA